VVGLSAGPPDPLGCDARLFDPDSTLDRAQVEPVIGRVATRLSADVWVRVERTLDAGLDARMAQLEAQCPGWTVAGERDPDLVVVMYSAQEREAAVYYGADQSLVLDARWEPAVDAMIAEFRAGQFTEGVVDGLETLSSPVSEMPVDPVTPIDPVGLPAAASDGGGTSFPTGFIVVFVLVLAVVAAINVARYLRTGEWGDPPRRAAGTAPPAASGASAGPTGPAGRGRSPAGAPGARAAPVAGASAGDRDDFSTFVGSKEA
jgi:hypothetical protein